MRDGLFQVYREAQCRRTHLDAGQAVDLRSRVSNQSKKNDTADDIDDEITKLKQHISKLIGAKPRVLPNDISTQTVWPSVPGIARQYLIIQGFSHDQREDYG